MEHRNSQKRFYGEGYTYFVTGVTKNRYRYFEEEIFSGVFWENLKLSQKIKEFMLHGWFLGYDHFHLLVTPMGDFNISKIIHNLKRVTSLQINQIIEGEDIYPRLQWNERMLKYRQRFIKKYPMPTFSFPKFMWQRSFHDHVIRGERDFETHLRYIEHNPIKHEMPEGWSFYGF